MNRSNKWLTALALSVGLPFAGLGAQPLALVADLSGRGAWAGGGALRVLDEVPANRSLRLAKGSHLVLVTIATGEALVFRGPGRICLDGQGRSCGTKPVEVRPHPPAGGLRLRPGGMSQAAVVMRDGCQDLSLALLPKGPVILDPLPEFRWQALDAQAAYRFKLFDGHGQVHLDQTLAGTVLAVPVERPLRRDEEYTWILEAQVPGQAPRVFTGRLRVLDAARRERLAQAQPGPGAAFPDRLMHIALLEDLQLRDEAGPGWVALARERPGEAHLEALAARWTRQTQAISERP